MILLRCFTLDLTAESEDYEVGKDERDCNAFSIRMSIIVSAK